MSEPPNPRITADGRARGWRSAHASKITSLAGAIAQIRPGRRILIGSGAAEPVRLVEALARDGHHLADNEIVHLLTLGPAPYVRPELASRFRHSAFFIGSNVREAVQDGRADFIPVFLSEIPELIRSRRVRVDVAMIQTSVPDAHGYVSLGVSVDVVRAAVDSADLVLAEINPRMPRTHGDSFLHVSRIHAMVPVDEPLLELASPAPGEIERAIGEHVARLVPDGATLQAGIGGIPDAVLTALSRHRNLGVHTEMLSDGMMRLARAGVIDGTRKSVLPGKLVTSFIMGSRALYEWAHDNPALELRGSEFTNDPRVIADNDQMVSVNSALAVDLTGQVAADTLLGKFFSGIGGQVDFVRGAARSRGGRSIIALRSTAQRGTVSRIQGAFEAGAGIVTSRGDVRFVVTEYGVADLWGKSVRERALALIEVAHPSFRAELLAQAKQRRYVFVDQRLPSAVYPWREHSIEKSKDGVDIVVRPVRMSDEEALQDLFYSLSDESARQRFMAYKHAYPHEEMQQLVDTDYVESLALVASDPRSGELIAMARYDMDPGTRFGDIAFAVRDEWQRRGLGSLLMRRMLDAARANGLRGFAADVLAGNRGMLMVFQQSGLTVQSRFDGSFYHLEMPFEAPTPLSQRP
ncbi:MAG TPA: GNAT family N-acetyltransferase, partial [Polyangiaceae bacterium]|nr:GNAT family N-acetyltransferase [Polyangiaceae bacterium]